MLQTYEATLETSGLVLFTDFAKPVYQQRQKILVTIVSPLVDSAIDTPLNTPLSTPTVVDAGKHDWQDFAGALKNAPVFSGDPLAIQQQLRSEWR